MFGEESIEPLDHGFRKRVRATSIDQESQGKTDGWGLQNLGHGIAPILQRVGVNNRKQDESLVRVDTPGDWHRCQFFYTKNPRNTAQMSVKKRQVLSVRLSSSRGHTLPTIVDSRRTCGLGWS